ncbi:MAG: M13 family metallopeptidase, partial [Spirosomaceae bacterium]|nr:M13 family metallopeptidase [Spirosomataceae bacterium]
MKKLVHFCFALFFAITASFAQKVVIPEMDSSVKPGDDFFMHVNGKWYNSVEIPSTQSGVGAYSFMNFPQRVRLQGILDSVSAAKNTMGSIEQKVGDYYASGMDISTINKRGFQPVKPTLQRIDGIKNVASLMKYVGEQTTVNNYSIIGFRVSPDIKKSTVNIINLGQTGLGLPERDYYFRTDSSTIAIQEAYKNYVMRLLTLTGVEAAKATKMAAVVYGIEKQLAASHKTNIERRKVEENYHKMAVSEITQKQSNIGWA